MSQADSDAIPLNCPYCGRPLAHRDGTNGSPGATYHCLRHGRFWLDEELRLQENRRPQDRPK